MALGNGLKEVDESRYFWLVDGNFIRDIPELRDTIADMDDNLYMVHANPKKNDFSNWLSDVFGEKELAERIRSAGREKAASIIDDFLSRRNSGEKMESITQKLKDIENRILKSRGESPAEEGESFKNPKDINKALEQLKGIYEGKMKENRPEKIVVHDTISRKDASVDLSGQTRKKEEFDYSYSDMDTTEGSELEEGAEEEYRKISVGQDEEEDASAESYSMGGSDLLREKVNSLLKELERERESSSKIVHESSKVLDTLKETKSPSIAAEEIELRASEVKERELALKEREKQISAKEKEQENMREEFIENIRKLVVHKKDLIEKEKMLLLLGKKLEAKDLRIKEKEKELLIKEKEFEKRQAKYENDVIELRKEIKRLIK